MTQARKTLGNIGKTLLAMTLLSAVGACGGGGGSSDGSHSLASQTGLPATPGSLPGSTTAASTSYGPITSKPGPNTASLVTPVCTSCPAVSNTQYSGSGTGIWSFTNTSAAIEVIPVSISGVKGQTVQLVYSNATANSADTSTFTTLLLPVTPVTASSASTAAAAVVKVQATAKAQLSAMDQAQPAVAEFNRHGYLSLLKPLASPGTSSAVAKVATTPATTTTTPPNSYALNAARAFFDTAGNIRHTTLVRQGTTSDGTIVDVWVEDSENTAGKVTGAIQDSLLNNYIRQGGIYDMITSIGGPLWGPQTRYSNLIPDNQPINIVVINFNNDATPYGIVGDFSVLNNVVPDPVNAPTSNGALMIYLDSETMYLGGTNGLPTMITTMAHESTHMQTFYRRNILLGPDFAYDTWLSEQTAMMMEDWVSYTLNPSFNNVRDVRAPDYVLEQSSNCSATDFDTTLQTCDSYSVNGSYGGFLNRQLGLAFYKDLLYRADATDSATLLDNAIRSANPATSMADSFTRFSVTMGALVPASGALSTYAFPTRSESGFTLVSIDPSAYAKLSPATPVTTVPAPLNPFAAATATRAMGSGTYSEAVPVPPGVTVSVVMH